MKKYLQPEEEDLEVDRIGLEHKKLLFCIMYNRSNKPGQHPDTNKFEPKIYIYIMDKMIKHFKEFLNEYPDAHIKITSKPK